MLGNFQVISKRIDVIAEHLDKIKITGKTSNEKISERIDVIAEHLDEMKNAEKTSNEKLYEMVSDIYGRLWRIG